MSLPDPTTRKERYLRNIADGEGTIPDDPFTREEIYLEAIAEKEGIPDYSEASEGDVLTKGSTGLEWSSIPIPSKINYITSAPTADNTTGLIICVLSTEPGTKYNGYLYIITS